MSAKIYTTLLSNAASGVSGDSALCTPKMQLQVQGTFGGGRVIIEIRILDTLDWVQAHFEDGTLVDITESYADALPQGLARQSQIRARTADGDGTMSITAVLAEVTL